jgi:phosphatidylserine/phosphatidylglycerophosphate/cardiolipin synthase-like enzyme
MAANFRQEFNLLYAGRLFGGLRQPVPFPMVNVGNAECFVYFSPQGGARQAVLDALGEAKKSIKVLAFALTEKSVSDMLIQRHHDGIAVEGIFDTCMIDSRSKFYTLRASGIKVWRDGNQALMHDKVIIIDDDTVITGSYNFTSNAELYNNETMMVIHSKELAETFLKEYDRLLTAARNNKHLPAYNHPACRHRGHDVDAKNL